MKLADKNVKTVIVSVLHMKVEENLNTMRASRGNPGYFKFHLKAHLEISKYYFARIGTSLAFLIDIFFFLVWPEA